MSTYATYRKDKNPRMRITWSYLYRNFLTNLLSSMSMMSPLWIVFLLNLQVLYPTLSMSSTDILERGTVLPRKRLCPRCGGSGKNWIKKIPPSEVWREGVGSGGVEWRGATLVTCGTPHRSPLSSPCCRWSPPQGLGLSYLPCWAYGSHTRSSSWLDDSLYG